jgi:hypothetical protein
VPDVAKCARTAFDKRARLLPLLSEPAGDLSGAFADTLRCRSRVTESNSDDGVLTFGVCRIALAFANIFVQGFLAGRVARRLALAVVPSRRCASRFAGVNLTVRCNNHPGRRGTRHVEHGFWGGVKNEQLRSSADSRAQAGRRVDHPSRLGRVV